MAPELWDGKSPTVKTDLYAVGCAGFELLTSQPPYSGDKAALRDALSGPYPKGEAGAIAEVRAVARGRADLLAQLAGIYLGLSFTQPVDQLAAQMVAQASLAARSGAEIDRVGRWIPVGVKRGEDIQPAHAALGLGTTGSFVPHDNLAAAPWTRVWSA
jgi:serine/threonine protein kinase